MATITTEVKPVAVEHIFGVSGYEYTRHRRVFCSCSNGIAGEVDTWALPNREVESCPKCGSTNKGRVGTSNINYYGFKILEVGDKQFKIEVYHKSFGIGSGKFTRNTVHTLHFDYLNKEYKIFMNGKDPRTKDIGAYLSRNFSNIKVIHVANALFEMSGSPFWRCIFGRFYGSRIQSLGDALQDLIRNDYSGIEIISTSRLGEYLKDVSYHTIYSNYSSNGILSLKGTNLRGIMGMTRGQINSLIRVLEYIKSSNTVEEGLKSNVLTYMGIYRRYISKGLSMQQVERLFVSAVDEGRLSFLKNYATDFINLVSDYGYAHDPVALMEYLVRTIKLEQGVMNPYEGMRLLRDYRRMMKDLERDAEKYPSSLKKVHDVAAMNYRVVEDALRARNFKKRTDAVREELTHRGRRFSFILPNEPKDLVKEGTSLHHCVASYVDDVIRGHCIIVFMRHNDSIDTPHVTIELRNGRVVQARGQSNRQCTQEEKDAIRAWANAKGIEYIR